MSCNKCKFAIYQDTGYSNYTVEGTDFYCAKRLHPEDGFDKWYGDDKRLEFGQTCVGRENGSPIKIDVDHEDIPELADEQKDILRMREDLCQHMWPQLLERIM